MHRESIIFSNLHLIYSILSVKVETFKIYTICAPAFMCLVLQNEALNKDWLETKVWNVQPSETFYTSVLLNYFCV